jgi:hypothetical protein
VTLTPQFGILAAELLKFVSVRSINAFVVFAARAFPSRPFAPQERQNRYETSGPGCRLFN